jgi:PAS domain S-box-containing protein
MESSDIQKADETLRISEEAARLIMNAALDAIICIDTDGVITFWNPQAEKIFGWKEEEVKGLCLSTIIIPKQYRAQHERGMKQYLESGKGPILNILFEITALNRSGMEFPVELTILPIQQPGAQFFCAFLRDITERKMAEHQQQCYAAELKQKNVEMEQFTYVASHDLQEPLRTVSSFVDLLLRPRDGGPDENTGRYIAYIKDASERMRKLVKDLLDYSRLGRQRTLEQTNCNDAMKEVLSDLSEAIRESGAVLHINHLPTITVFPTEIKQLFQNLLTNSLKFRKKEESPVIRITAYKLNQHWQFSIEDNGIGIEKKYWNRIFVIFQRLHTKAEYEGTGIGLAHCKKIAELHEGKIWLDSLPGQGATFYFTVRMNQTDHW